MADQENTDQQQSGSARGDRKPSATQGLFTWVITLAIVVGGAVGGFALAQLIAGAGPKDVKARPTAPEEDFFATPDSPGTAPWQYNLETVIANLDEPGVTRFLRVTITLVMAPETKGRVLLDDLKAPVLTDFVSSYIAGLTLERVRGQGNRNRIKREIQDGFNEILFPNSKPYVRDILFREFAVQ
ncbi:MAG: flagellar basal body-associated FliL family protein [Phycisphaerae bacterium]|nr:flagellar basal body-associated FliL family protein [Phycisphaerae bacterium]